MHQHSGIDDLFLSDALDLVQGLEAQLDGIATLDNVEMLLVDLAHGGLQAIPLRFILFAALGDRQRVVEAGVVGPQREFTLGGVAGKEVEDGIRDEGLLLVER